MTSTEYETMCHSHLSQEALDFGVHLVEPEEADVRNFLTTLQGRFDRGFRPMYAKDIQAPFTAIVADELLGMELETYTTRIVRSEPDHVGEPQFWDSRGTEVYAESYMTVWVEKDGVPPGYTFTRAFQEFRNSDNEDVELPE